MALVPMEERLKSKEQAWDVERKELELKAEEGLRTMRGAEERCRELEKKKTEMAEER